MGVEQAVDNRVVRTVRTREVRASVGELDVYTRVCVRVLRMLLTQAEDLGINLHGVHPRGSFAKSSRHIVPRTCTEDEHVPDGSSAREREVILQSQRRQAWAPRDGGIAQIDGGLVRVVVHAHRKAGRRVELLERCACLGCEQRNSPFLHEPERWVNAERVGGDLLVWRPNRPLSAVPCDETRSDAGERRQSPYCCARGRERTRDCREGYKDPDPWRRPGRTEQRKDGNTQQAADDVRRILRERPRACKRPPDMVA